MFFKNIKNNLDNSILCELYSQTETLSYVDSQNQWGEGRVSLLKQIGKFIACLLPVVFLVSSTLTAMSATRENWIDFAAGDFSCGNGTAENPYRISNAGELALVSYAVNEDCPNFGGKNYVLESDIDLSGKEWTPIAHTYHYDCRESFSLAFNGVFDGRGHKVSGILINRQDSGYSGLFGMIGRGGTVKNVTLASADIRCDGAVVGTLAGDNDGTVENCAAEGYIEGDHAVGGLVGWNHGIVRDSGSNCVTSGDYEVGGLIGTNVNYGAVLNCSASGIAIGGRKVGGLVGSNLNAGTITDCAASVDMRAAPTNVFIGKLVGENKAEIQPVPEYEGAVGSREPAAVDLIGPLLKGFFP